MCDPHESIPQFRIEDATLFKGKKITGLARGPLEHMNNVQEYLRLKFNLTEEESLAVIITTNYDWTGRRPQKTPEEWVALAEQASSKIDWNEVPDRLDDNIVTFPQRG